MSVVCLNNRDIILLSLLFLLRYDYLVYFKTFIKTFMFFFFFFIVSHNLKDCTTSTAPSLLLVDARSYTAAFANRAKGGGCEYQGKFYFQLYFILSCFAIGNEGLQDKNEIVLDRDRQCQQCHLFQTINLDGCLNVFRLP